MRLCCKLQVWRDDSQPGSPPDDMAPGTPTEGEQAPRAGNHNRASLFSMTSSTNGYVLCLFQCLIYFQ